MSREWKPGDVALVCNEFGVWNVAICTLRADRAGWWWRFGVADSWMPVTANARPLVVIDPEDREQVERLVVILRSQPSGGLGIVDRYALGLREFANPTPPKPEEPTGLGAVVEDDEGNLWVRGHSLSGWFDLTSDLNNRRYDDINAVRVLSEGVTS